MGLMTAYFSPMFSQEWAHPVLSPPPGWFYGIMAVVGVWLFLLLGVVWQARRGQGRYATSYRHVPRARQSSPRLPWPQSRMHRIWGRWRTPHRGREKLAPLVKFPHTIRPPKPPRAFPQRR